MKSDDIAFLSSNVVLMRSRVIRCHTIQFDAIEAIQGGHKKGGREKERKKDRVNWNEYQSDVSASIHPSVNSPNRCAKNFATFLSLFVSRRCTEEYWVRNTSSKASWYLRYITSHPVIL